MPARGARMFHEAGVGSRTGMRAPSMGGAAGVDDLSAYLAAGQRALDEDDEDDEDDDAEDWAQSGEESLQEESENETRTSLRKRKRGDRAAASSSSRMDIEQSSPPSPRRAIRRTSAYTRPADEDSDAGSVVDHEDDLGPSRRRVTRLPDEDYDVEVDFGTGNSFDLSGNGPRDMDDVYSDEEDLLQQPRAAAGSSKSRDDGKKTSAPTAGLAARRKAAAARSARLEDYSQDEEDDVRAMLNGAADNDALMPSPSPPLTRAPAKSKAAAKKIAASAAAPSKKRGRPPKQPSASQSAPKRAIAKSKAASTDVSQQQQRVVEQVSAGDRERSASVEGGLRRSGRYRYAPLEHWRGETVRYGRPSLPAVQEEESEEEEGARRVARGAAVPVLKEIIRVPRAQGEGTFSGMRKKRVVKRARKPIGNGATRTPSVTKNEEGVEVITEYAGPAADEPTQNFEDGWDDETPPNALVWDAAAGMEVERRVVCTRKQVRPRPAANASFGFEKIFTLEDHMASGMLEIEIGGDKPYKPSKDNNYVFVVLEGAVDVTIHRTDFRLAPGGIFMVPKDNSYSIRNICHRPVRVFFAQARKPVDPNASNLYTQAATGGEQSFGNMTYSQPPLQDAHLYTSDPFLAPSSSRDTSSRYARR
ncbi:hypothetical protein IE81DRAFT_321796 [Ceraceosorus guamensis]|uniref:Mif2/CENP-C cupin domain-containing protein n=1 Tax=Ceraceosorus guamensis TaxID=1522189 RepID=A0A316W2A4_9BASI|nr:hypothetical protein IE81DRAFT_321796 [Ceraceosorus guamensis]PWN43890.1 hypothetical protein IE81DRAFT_321796 [Ceraceosorus guamensis]